MNSNNPVMIARFSQVLEAELARSRLEAEGIPSYLADANTIGLNAYYSQALGGVRLMVSEKDARRAATVLESVRLNAAEAAPSEPERCEHCGSQQIERTRRARWPAILLSYLLLGLPLPFLRKNSRCKACGKACGKAC